MIISASVYEEEKQWINEPGKIALFLAEIVVREQPEVDDVIAHDDQSLFRDV